MIDKLQLFIERLITSRKHSGTSKNITLFKMLRQGIPYYLNRNGFAYPPLTIFLTINGKCNLECRMCDIGQKNKDSMFYQNLKGDSSQDFPYERFKTLIDEVSFYKPYFGITTTEPLLYPNMFEGVSYARSKDIYMNISTNGVLLEKKVDEILESGLHRLSISLDGPSHIHDKMRGIKGTYDKIMKGLEILTEKKKAMNLKFPQIYFTSFICDTNYNHLVELVEKLPKDGVDRINIKHMVFSTDKMVEKHNELYGDKYPATTSCIPEDFSPNNLNLEILYSQTKEIKKRFSDICTLHFDVDRQKMEQYYYRPLDFMDNTKCIFPWFIAQVNASCELMVFTRCYNINFGSILNKPLLDVWNAPKIREFRKDLKKHGRFPGCSRCDGVLYR